MPVTSEIEYSGLSALASPLIGCLPAGPAEVGRRRMFDGQICMHCCFLSSVGNRLCEVSHIHRLA